MSLTVTPSDATLGATVRGIDLGAPIEDAVFREIENAWHERAVLIFPEQNIADEAQIAFSRRFGKLERNVTENNVGHNPEVIVLSNVRDDLVVLLRRRRRRVSTGASRESDRKN